MKLGPTKTIVFAFFALCLSTAGCFGSRLGRGLDVLNREIPFISFECVPYMDAIEATFLYAKQVGENYCLEISTRSDCVTICFKYPKRGSDLCKVELSEDDRLRSLVTCEFRNKTVREILESISRQAKFDIVVLKVR